MPTLQANLLLLVHFDATNIMPLDTRIQYHVGRADLSIGVAEVTFMIQILPRCWIATTSERPFSLELCVIGQSQLSQRASRQTAAHLENFILYLEAEENSAECKNLFLCISIFLVFLFPRAFI